MLRFVFSGTVLVCIGWASAIASDHTTSQGGQAVVTVPSGSNERLREAQRLEEKARVITEKLGELALSGKLPTSEEAIELMRRMLDEMSAIRRQMDALAGEVSHLKTERRPSSIPSAANDGAVVGGYLQTQFRDTNQAGGANDAFSVRRMRLGISKDLDPQIKVKLSAELATGTNQTQAQLRDAFITYSSRPDSPGPAYHFQAGQMPLPVGYELRRSSSDREFPERAVYNQKLFNGERSRGMQVALQPRKGVTVFLGGYNALTINDPEQSSSAPGPEGRLAMAGGVRLTGVGYEFGVSGLVGERARFTSGSGMSAVTHPRVDREFYYIDGVYRGFLDPKLTLRGEVMLGHDRLPVTGTPSSSRVGTDMAGWQVQADYASNAKNRFHLRVEQFDPDRRRAGDALNGLGLAWSHFLSPELKLTAAQEWFRDQTRSSQPRYHVTTLRVQLKF